MKLTAVEFAVEKLEKFIPEGNQIAIYAILDQAKEMEKAEKIKAQMECLNRAKDLDIQSVYNELKQQLETFKSE
jgi:hypothetical protein